MRPNTQRLSLWLLVMLGACSETNPGGGGGDAGAGSGAQGAGGLVGTGAVGGSGATGAGTGAAQGTGGSTATGGVQGDGACAGQPWYCFALCQGGQCSCECDADPGCPLQEPTADTTCFRQQLCGYGEPACWSIWECDLGRWAEVASTCADAQGGACPDTLEEALATPCLARTCGYGTQLCACQGPACSGVYVEPSTMCSAPTPAICQRPTVAGEACAIEGQSCGQTCCGRSYHCTEGVWVARDNLCPP